MDESSEAEATSAPIEVVPARARPWERPAVVLPTFAVVALVGGFFGSFTLNANLLVLLVGGVFVWLAFSGLVTRRRVATVPRGALWWSIPIVLMGLVELNSFLRGSTAAYPSFSLLTDPLLEHYWPRVVFYLAWLGGFWVLVRR